MRHKIKFIEPNGPWFHRPAPGRVRAARGGARRLVARAGLARAAELHGCYTLGSGPVAGADPSPPPLSMLSAVAGLVPARKSNRYKPAEPPTASPFALGVVAVGQLARGVIVAGQLGLGLAAAGGLMALTVLWWFAAGQPLVAALA